jgi:hypothetical protein
MTTAENAKINRSSNGNIGASMLAIEATVRPITKNFNTLEITENLSKWQDSSEFIIV